MTDSWRPGSAGRLGISLRRSEARKLDKRCQRRGSRPGRPTEYVVAGEVTMRRGQRRQGRCCLMTGGPGSQLGSLVGGRRRRVASCPGSNTSGPGVCGHCPIRVRCSGGYRNIIWACVRPQRRLGAETRSSWGSSVEKYGKCH